LCGVVLALRLAFLASLLAATACQDVAYSLDEVDDLALQVRVSSSSEGASVTVFVGGNNDGIALDESFGLIVDGRHSSAPRDAIHRGNDDLDFYEPPQISMLVPPSVDSDVDLAITDRSKTVHIALGDLLVPRTATWVQPATGVIHSGDAIAVRWSPESDLQRGEVIAIDADPAFHLYLRKTVDGTLAATVPTVTTTGDRTLRLVWAPAWRTAVPVPCRGARCTLEASTSTSLIAHADAR
jgi:hypothetical protein